MDTGLWLFLSTTTLPSPTSFPTSSTSSWNRGSHVSTASLAPERIATVGLVGQGWLQATLQRRLTHSWQAMPLDLSQGVEAGADDLDGCAIVVLVSDGWDPGLHIRLNAECLARGIPWLPAYVEPGRAVIGPCVLPGRHGCVACAQTRRQAACSDLEEYAQLVERCAGQLADPRQSWLTTATAELIAELITDEVDRITTRPEQARTQNALLCLDLAGLATSMHRFLAHPRCEACGDLPDDAAEAARIVVRPQPKASPSGYRVRPLVDLQDRDRLLARYVDAEVGILPSLTKAADTIFPNARAPVSLPHSSYRTAGFGRTLDFRAAELTAITEALERYGGLAPGGKRTTVRATYNQLGESALDPTRLGLHSQTQYALPRYPYQRYHHDLELAWVWGYSFAGQRPLLVPETYAYYGYRHHRPEDRPFVYETSNGCALGGCLEEAILYGLLEVAERDAFLLTWYARLPAPRLELASCEDRSTALIIERFEHATGHTVHAFNTTVEQRIPCVWVIAVDEHDRPDQPKALCAAGAHLDPNRALTNALLELARQTEHAIRTYADDRDRILEMLTDPSKVREMADHAPLYCAPEAFDRLSFLVDSPRTQTFADAFGDRHAPGQDLSADLREVIAAYLDTSLDVIVVDQTAPEHAAEGFTCVKVIVPGTLPMTFGHHARRLQGLDRILRIGYELGYHPRPLTETELNSHPHPFP
jgi:ribosomal protein S12 methylthiotransferase accessory factor